MDSEKEQHSEEFFKKLIKTQLKEKVLKAKISFDGRNFLIRLPKKLTETLNWTKENNKDFEAEFTYDLSSAEELKELKCQIKKRTKKKA